MKLKVIILSLILLSSTILSQSIIIKVPSGGESWVTDRGYYLSWDKKGIMKNLVKIRLMSPNGKVKVLDITNSTPNNGSFFWKIPGSLPFGQYSLLIKTVDNKFSDDSLPFNISDSTKQDLKMWEPVSGVSFTHKEKFKITWYGTNLSGNLNIFLKKTDGSAKITIKSNHPASDSTISYTIPNTVISGTYIVNVVWGAITADSGVFTIKSTKLSKRMDIISPKKGEAFPAGGTLPIEWISSGLSGNTLRVFLCKGVNGVHYISTISNVWPNAPHMNSGWGIPKDIQTGFYKIVVQEGIGTYYHGNIFRITLPASVSIAKPSRINRAIVTPDRINKMSSGKSPSIISFKPDKLARKKIQSLKGGKDEYLAKLNFSWKDDDGNLSNGKWHFSYKGMKSGITGNKTGTLKSATYIGNFIGKNGVISGFGIMGLTGIEHEDVEIAFVIEDESGNFSTKVTGYVTLSPY